MEERVFLGVAKRVIGSAAFLLYFFLYFNTVSATEFTSTNFKVIDPVISVGGGRATSDSFQLERSLGQPAIGISTSDNFQVKAGSLYFPAPEAESTPTPTPAAAEAGGGKPLSELAGTFLQPFLYPFLPPAVLKECPFGFKVTDLNCDGEIGLQDLSIILSYGLQAISDRTDFNSDGSADTADLSILFSDWTEKLFAFTSGEPFQFFETPRRSIGGERQFATIGEVVAPEKPVSIEQPRQDGLFKTISRIFKSALESARSLLRFLYR